MGMKILLKNMFFSLKKDNRTREHEVTLVKDLHRLDIRKYSFSQRAISEWNKLSTNCVTASSINMFKNKVDTVEGGLQIDFKNFDSISQWFPCPLAIWAFVLDGNLVKSC